MPSTSDHVDDPVTRAILETRNGNEDAYGIVVQAFQKRLRHSLAWRCPAHVDPDEVAHLAFLAAYKRIASFRPGTDFYAWLRVFARNIMLAQINKAKRAARNRDVYRQRLMLEFAEYDPEARDPEAGGRHTEALRDCLAALPEAARSLLCERYGEEHSLAALARRLGRSANALKNQLFHLRQSLRQCVTRKINPAV